MNDNGQQSTKKVTYTTPHSLINGKFALIYCKRLKGSRIRAFGPSALAPTPRGYDSETKIYENLANRDMENEKYENWAKETEKV